MGWGTCPPLPYLGSASDRTTTSNTQIASTRKANPNSKSKLSCPTSISAPLRRSPRLLLLHGSADGQKTQAFTKNKKKVPSSATCSSTHSDLNTKTRSSCKTVTANPKDLDEKRMPTGVRRRSPRFCNLGTDSGEEKPVQMERGRRRSPRLSISKWSEEKDSRFIHGTPAMGEGGKRRRVEKRKLADGTRFVKLGGDGEKEEDMLEYGGGGFSITSLPEEETIDGFGRMKVCESVQSYNCSTLKTAVEGKGKKRRKFNDGKKVDDLVLDSKVQAWTSEHDQKLHKAYLSARPSPHFWKKVSKLVPGKSAKECFDRVHSKFLTPPLSQRPLRTNKSNQSPVSHFNLSGDNPTTFFSEIVKKVRSKKERKLIARREVRHLLRKHCSTDQGREADLFPFIQASIDASAAGMICTNISKYNDNLNSTMCTNTSKREDYPNSMGDRLKAKSLFSLLDKENKPSPEVLKKLKNPALHEKYIDQLHRRETGWKASTWLANPTCKTGFEKNMGVVKEAKSVLLSEAKEAILQYQHSNLTSDLCTKIDDENNDDWDETDIEDA